MAVKQEEVAAAARVKEVAYQLEQRVRQELAHPSVVHFYTWLLQGEQSCVTSLHFNSPPSASPPVWHACVFAYVQGRYTMHGRGACMSVTVQCIDSNGAVVVICRVRKQL